MSTDTVTTATTTVPKVKKEKKEKKDHPKQVSGYIVYGFHWRANLNKDKLTGKDVMSAIGKDWKLLNKTQQGVYNEQAKTQNETTINAYIKEHPTSEWTTTYKKKEEKAKTVTASVPASASVSK
jgi:HMG-box domain